MYLCIYVYTYVVGVVGAEARGQAHTIESRRRKQDGGGNSDTIVFCNRTLPVGATARCTDRPSQPFYLNGPVEVAEQCVNHQNVRTKLRMEFTRVTSL